MIIWSPREYDAVPDHLVNAALGAKCAWRQWDRARLDAHIRDGGSLKICVDGSMRRGAEDQAALGYAVYMLTTSSSGELKYTLAGLEAMLVEDIHSAFQSECAALECALRWL